MTPQRTFYVEQILIAQSYFLYIIALSQHGEINLHDNTFCYVASALSIWGYTEFTCYNSCYYSHSYVIPYYI